MTDDVKMTGERKMLDPLERLRALRNAPTNPIFDLSSDLYDSSDISDSSSFPRSKEERPETSKQRRKKNKTEDSLSKRRAKYLRYAEEIKNKKRVNSDTPVRRKSGCNTNMTEKSPTVTPKNKVERPEALKRPEPVKTNYLDLMPKRKSVYDRLREAIRKDNPVTSSTPVRGKSRFNMNMTEISPITKQKKMKKIKYTKNENENANEVMGDINQQIVNEKNSERALEISNGKVGSISSFQKLDSVENRISIQSGRNVDIRISKAFSDKNESVPCVSMAPPQRRKTVATNTSAGLKKTEKMKKNEAPKTPITVGTSNKTREAAYSPKAVSSTNRSQSAKENNIDSITLPSNSYGTVKSPVPTKSRSKQTPFTTIETIPKTGDAACSQSNTKNSESEKPVVNKRRGRPPKVKEVTNSVTSTTVNSYVPSSSRTRGRTNRQRSETLEEENTAGTSGYISNCSNYWLTNEKTKPNTNFLTKSDVKISVKSPKNQLKETKKNRAKKTKQQKNKTNVTNNDSFQPTSTLVQAIETNENESVPPKSSDADVFKKPFDVIENKSRSITNPLKRKPLKQTKGTRVKKSKEQEIENSRNTLAGIDIDENEPAPSTRIPQIDIEESESVPSTRIPGIDVDENEPAPSTRIPRIDIEESESVPSTRIPGIDVDENEPAPSTRIPRIDIQESESEPSTRIPGIDVDENEPAPSTSSNNGNIGEVEETCSNTPINVRSFTEGPFVIGRKMTFSMEGVLSTFDWCSGEISPMTRWDDASLSTSTIFKMGDTEFGIMEINKGSTKKWAISRTNNLVFNIISGQAQAMVYNRMYNLSTSSMFFIPKGARYKIINLSDTQVLKLQFTKTPIGLFRQHRP